MDTKDQVAAGNALVGWFNSQEIPPADARAIMSKVIAKLIVDGVKSKSNRGALSDHLDVFILQLVHDINNRSFDTRKG